MIVRWLRNTWIETREKTCVLRECNTQIPSGKQGPQQLFSPIKICQRGPLTKKTERPSSAQSPITKKTEMRSDLFVGKPLRGDQISSWGQTGGSLCPPWRLDLFVGASKALLYVEMRSDQSRGKENTTSTSKMKISSTCGQADQRKGATNQQIEGEPLTSTAKVSTPTSS